MLDSDALVCIAMVVHPASTLEAMHRSRCERVGEAEGVHAVEDWGSALIPQA